MAASWFLPRGHWSLAQFLARRRTIYGSREPKQLVPDIVYSLVARTLYSGSSTQTQVLLEVGVEEGDSAGGAA